MRIEPSPSLPCAIGTSPAATAAAAPPDEPPGVRSVRHGLRVDAVGVVGDRPEAQLGHARDADHDRARRRAAGVRPRGPARRPGRRAAADPCQVGRPATGVFSLTATGTPASGEVGQVLLLVDRLRLGDRLAGAHGPERVERRVADGDLLEVIGDHLRWRTRRRAGPRGRSASRWRPPRSSIGSSMAAPSNAETPAETARWDLSRAPAPDRRADRQRSRCRPTVARGRRALQAGSPRRTGVCHPARDARSATRRRRVTRRARTVLVRLQISTRLPRRRRPRGSDTMPPNRRICLAAISWPGCVCRPG